jgi:hypothetical protein
LLLVAAAPPALREPIPALAAPEVVEPRAPPPWPELAAVFPGALIFGSGTWLQGRSATSERLLLLEGASLLAIVAGGLVVYETGAARHWAGPAELTIGLGAGTLSASFLANLYATWAPQTGWAGPEPRLPLLAASVGYLYAADPQFDDHHFLTTELDARLGPWHLQLDTAHSPTPGNQRIELLAGFRALGQGALGARAGASSFLEPQLAFSSHRFDSDGFVSSVLQVAIDSRLDAQELLPDVKGGFFQAMAGLARQWVAFDVPGAPAQDASSMLLLRMGFGLYLGRAPGALPTGAPAPNAGELEFYYDHRRDGFAGGLKTAGPISGFAGHLGLSGEYLFSEAWGLRALGEVGSHWVFGMSALLRAGAP